MNDTCEVVDVEVIDRMGLSTCSISNSSAICILWGICYLVEAVGEWTPWSMMEVIPGRGMECGEFGILAKGREP